MHPSRRSAANFNHRFLAATWVIAAVRPFSALQGAASKMRSLIVSYLVLLALCLNGFADENVIRKWSDSSGKFSLEATYVSCDDYQVALIKANGDSLTVPVTRLCAQDQEYVKSRVLETQKPSKEIADLLAYLEVCRDAAVLELEQEKTNTFGNADEKKVMDEYNEFYALNPELRKFEPSSRGRIETARGKAKQEQAAKLKAIDRVIKELKKSLFVPTYTVNQFGEQLAAVSSLTYEQMYREKGLNADADALHNAVRLNHKSVGYYQLRVRVDNIQNETMAIVSAKNGTDEFDVSDAFCLECDTRSIRHGSEFDLPNQLYFAKSVTKVSYPTGDNTSVSNQTVLVIAPYPVTPKQLEDEFARSKKARSVVFDPTRESMARLQKAKAVLKTDRISSVSQMQEILAKFPGTIAATEAAAVLKNLQSP